MVGNHLVTNLLPAEIKEINMCNSFCESILSGDKNLAWLFYETLNEPITDVSIK